MAEADQQVLAEMFIFSDEMMKKGLSDREYVKVYCTYLYGS